LGVAADFGFVQAGHEDEVGEEDGERGEGGPQVARVTRCQRPDAEGEGQPLQKIGPSIELKVILEFDNLCL